ncbi:hypothetical protein MKK58_00035, partial [Methylobacterium sp. J-078]|nr:hypothetical protein [Methylobacterium sp. J-078]
MVKPPPTPDIPPSLGGKRALDFVVVQAKADPSAVRTLRCRTEAQGRLSQLNYIRDLPPQPVMENEPEGILGAAAGPYASEALLAALGSCLSIGINSNALAGGIAIRLPQPSVAAV